MKRILLIIALLSAGLGAAGCFDFFKNMTSPTPAAPTIDQMNGSWTSVSSATTLTDTCTNFRWTVADAGSASNAASGAFTATCLGTMAVQGTAAGTLSGMNLAWTATAAGATPAGASCPVALTGTATFDGTQIRVVYTGTTCQGPVSGAEILRKP